MTGNDFFSPEFVRTVAPHGAWAFEQLEAFNEYLPTGDWTVNLTERIFRQSGRDVSVSVLGSYAMDDDTWLWGWANPQWAGSPAVEAADAVRAAGVRDGIPEFTTDLVHLSGFSDPRMAAETLALGAMAVLGSRGYIGVTSNPTGRLYMVVADDDKGVPRARPDAITMPRMLMTGAGFLPGPPDAVVAGYFAHHGMASVRTGPALLAVLPSGDNVTVDFDDQGRIGRIGVQAGSRAVPSGAWRHNAGDAAAEVLRYDAAFNAFLEQFPYQGHDLAAGTLRCGPHDVRIRVLGRVNAARTTWTWDTGTHGRLAALPGLAQAPEAAPVVDLSGCADPAEALTLLSHGAAGLLDGGCCVDLPGDDGGTVYVCIDDPLVPRA
ncbi:DUF6882 domain-containing protein [Yinghuangia soli]|uniref:Uncharacterized protein n=1 Tax=Yinghuangia soli TaxID=2908204 RepID=A0AA41PZU9_9ACTN|nr:DUF6882 domain-containing protein [Yinghuangia soli]MCF2528716.1 hypothetical protein [Yinghuangia soli]